MFKLKEKWKSFKESIIRENKIFDVLYLMKKYNNVKFEELIQINNSNCYIIKRCDFLYFAVKKPNWKNYVGIHRSFYDDLSQDTYCTIDFNNLKFAIFLIFLKLYFNFSLSNLISKSKGNSTLV